MGLTATNVLINVFYYGVTVALLPWACLAAERALGIPRYPAPALQVAGAAAVVAGVALQAWCIALFQRAGGGTPSPAVPTRRLVRRGPYAWVRNPMNIGEVVVFIGIAAWFGSAALLTYALAAAIAFHTFVVCAEEPRNGRAFGAAYGEYRRSVRRWMPSRPARMRPR